MPKIIKKAAPALLGVAFAAATGGVGFLGLSGWQAIVARVAVNFVVSGITSKLEGKPKSGSVSAGSFRSQAQARTQMINQPVVPREIGYGEFLKSGSLVDAYSTADRKYLHVVIAILDHKVASLDEVWIADDVIPNDWLDASGNVVSGKYAGKMRIRKHLGDANQVADPVLVAEVDGWSETDRGRSIAYLYIRLEKDSKLFPSGLPGNISVITRAKEIYDSRTGQTAWTPNMALAAHDYLTETRFGFAADAADVSEEQTESAANSCEEIVDTQTVDAAVTAVTASSDIITLSAAASPLLPFQRGDRVEIVTTGTAPGGLAESTDYYLIPYQWKGTPRIKLAASLEDAFAGVAIDITDSGSGVHTIRKTGEPRYCGGGVLSTAAALGENLRDILSGMAGKVANTGGLWKIFPAVWRAPADTFDESHLRGPLVTTANTGVANLYNAVNGTFVSPQNNWQPADYPLVRNSTYIDADGGLNATTQDLPMTQRASTAQRISTIGLNLHRQEIVTQNRFKLHAIELEPLATFGMDNARNGWSGKAFEVQDFRFVIDDDGAGGPVLGIDITGKETASACYDWNYGDELTTDPAPNTNLPNAFDVDQLVGISVNSIAVQTQGGDTYYNVVVSWDAIENYFVTNRGHVHTQFRLHGDDDWLPAVIVPGDQTSAVAFSGELGTSYDVRAWAVNSKGVPGDPVELDNVSVGSIGGVGFTLDYGSVADSVGATNDWGGVADSVGATNDWGGVA